MDKFLKVALLLTAVDRMSSVVDSATKRSGRALTELEKKQKSMQKSAMIGAGLIAAGSQGLNMLKEPIQQAADFETKMADIRKVVNEFQNDSKGLARMGVEIQRLSYDTGVATSEIQDMVAAGGRMGIAKDDLIAYSRETIKMSMAFEMAGQEIGESMGKIATIFRIPMKDIGKLGDAINYLDDNALAKGGDIMDVMMRTAGTATQIGLAEQKLAALSSTFLSLGSSREVAGTAINAFMREMAIAPVQGNRFHAGLKAINMTDKEMAAGMAKDPQAMMLGVLDKLNKFKKEEQVQVATLLFGKQYGDDISKLAVNVKEYRRQLSLLNNAKKEGSMQREFNIRNVTGNSQMQQWNNVKEALSVNVGSPMMEVLKQLGAVLKPLLIGMAEFARRHPNIVKMVGIFIALSSVLMILVGVFFLVKAAIIGIGLVMAFVGAPLLLIPLAIAAAAAVIFVYWTPIKAFFINLWAGIVGAFSKAWEFIKNIFSKMGSYLKDNWKSLLIGALMGPFVLLHTLLFTAGGKIPEMIGKGIKAGVGKVWDAVKGMASDIMSFLPQSPAKKGPLTNLSKVHIVEEIAKTLTPGKANKAMGNLVTGMTGPVNGGGRSSGSGAGSPINITFAPVINAAGGDSKSILAMLKMYEAELLKMVKSAIEKEKRVSF